MNIYIYIYLPDIAHSRCKMGRRKYRTHAFNTRELLSNVEEEGKGGCRRREGSKLWKMRQQFRKWHSPLPPRTQLYRYTRAHDAGITNALGDCFLSTVFSPSPSPLRTALTIYRHPASSRKLFRQAFKACLVSLVVTLTSKRRLHFLFSISRRRVPRECLSRCFRHGFDGDDEG